MVIVFGGIFLVIAGGAAWLLWGGPAEDIQRTPIVDTRMHGAAAGAPAMAADEIVVPQLSAAASTGQGFFEARCASCHGKNAAGTDKGPPLVHRIYEPSHHADFAFVRAVRNGVRSHHWRYGDMQPVEGVTDKQIEWIATYVRELQRANGIN
ncbi:MAG: cytochrome c [Thermohalobaculum sp.]|nr:cytochrome c [Thermohalobaculum sp.]